MAKLSAHGTEILRYLEPARGALISVRSDGTRLIRYAGDTWKFLARKKAEVSLEAWIAKKRAYVEALPVWAQECKSLPSISQLEEWSRDGICETVDGTGSYETDFQGVNGSAPSWLVALRYI